MRDVVNAWVVFFGYAVLAVFAQNAIFTRALGVSRLVQLVGDDRTSSWLFGLQLCITQVLVAPLAWYAGSWIVPLENRAQLRPLAYVAAIAVVCTAEELVLGLGRRLPLAGKLLRIVPAAALNSCVLGTVLVERTQSFTLMQSLGFGPVSYTHLDVYKRQVYTRDQLLDEVWGFEYYGDSRTIDVHVKRLREKLAGASDKWELKTVWGVGYKFEVRQ